MPPLGFFLMRLQMTKPIKLFVYSHYYNGHYYEGNENMLPEVEVDENSSPLEALQERFPDISWRQYGLVQFEGEPKQETPVWKPGCYRYFATVVIPEKELIKRLQEWARIQDVSCDLSRDLLAAADALDLRW